MVFVNHVTCVRKKQTTTLSAPPSPLDHGLAYRDAIIHPSVKIRHTVEPYTFDFTCVPTTTMSPTIAEHLVAREKRRLSLPAKTLTATVAEISSVAQAKRMISQMWMDVAGRDAGEGVTVYVLDTVGHLFREATYCPEITKLIIYLPLAGRGSQPPGPCTYLNIIMSITDSASGILPYKK